MDKKDRNIYLTDTEKEYKEAIKNIDDLLLQCKKLKQENKQLLKKSYGKTNKQGKIHKVNL